MDQQQEQEQPGTPPAQDPAQQQQQPQQGAQPAQGAPAGQGGPQISDRAKSIYQRLVMAAQKVLYNQQTTSAVMQVLHQADPVTGIVKATFFVLDGLAEKTKGLNPKAVYQIAPVVALLVAELAVEAKLIPDDLKAIAPQVLQGLKAEQAQREGAGQGGQPPQPGQQPPAQQQPQQAQAQPPAGGPPAPSGLVNGAMGAA